MPVDTTASRKGREARRRRSSSDTMQAVIVRTVCAFGARKAARSPAASKIYRKQLHMGCVGRGRDDRFGFWVKSGNLSLWPMLCWRASATNRRRPAESIADACTGLGTRSHRGCRCVAALHEFVAGPKPADPACLLHVRSRRGLCCKSRRAGPVKWKFETIESGGRFF